MKGLIDAMGFIEYKAPRIEVGFVDINEPDVEKWALYDEDNNIMFFVLKNDYYSIIDFDETLKPADYEPCKYKYINGEFVLNPDWVSPPIPIKEQVELLVEQNSASISGGDWDERKFYREGDYVTYGIGLYKCQISNYGIEPSDTRHWKSTNVSSELNELSDLIRKGI